MGHSTWYMHQGTHIGQDMGNTGRGVCDAGHGTKYMTWGHGAQHIKVQQRGPEDPFHVSAWGPSMQWQEPMFSSHKGQPVFCCLLPVSVGAKEWACPRGVGPRVSPSPPQLRQGSRLGAKSIAQEEPARPPDPVSQRQLYAPALASLSQVIFL